MDKQFNTFFQKFIKQHSISVFDNIPKCKSLLLDSAKGEFGKEIRLLLLAIESSFPATILKSNDLNLTRPSLIKQLQNEYFINDETSALMVDLLLLILRNFKRKNNKEDMFDEKSKNATVNRLASLTGNNNTPNSITDALNNLNTKIASINTEREQLANIFAEKVKHIYRPAFEEFKEQMSKNNFKCSIHEMGFRITFRFSVSSIEYVINYDGLKTIHKRYGFSHQLNCDYKNMDEDNKLTREVIINDLITITNILFNVNG